MAKITLYTHPMSRGRVVRWMLEEVGATYEVKTLTFGKDMKGPEYLAINPMGKVPAIRHGETVVTECAAICAYLADAFSEAGLAPAIADRGDYYRWLFFSAGPLEAALTNRSMGFEVPQEKKGMTGYGSYELVLKALEQAVTRSDFIAGNTFSAADVYIGSYIAWAMQFGGMEKRPAFEAYVARAIDRPAYRRAAELDNALAAEMQKAS